MERNLNPEDLDPDPIVQFVRWFEDARAAAQPEPEAMAVATATRSGVPSVRFVLMRGIDDRGFVFYTNQQSRKGRELEANPTAALAFRWAVVERQVRVEGTVELVSAQESDAYFAGRPRGAQISAWASAQSEPTGSRAALESAQEGMARRFEGAEVARPPWWGGYRVQPLSIEFWQGRINRLHDRFCYRRSEAGAPWVVSRLSP